MNILNLVTRVFFHSDTYISKKALVETVEKGIYSNKKALEKLEKYDKGEISKPKHLSRYTSVRDYLRDVEQEVNGGRDNMGRSVTAI